MESPPKLGPSSTPETKAGSTGILAMAPSYIVSFGDENRGYQMGVNYGSIYPPPEQPETPPTPLSTVPFRRDPDFVSRDSLLDQIHKKVSVPGSRISLVGIGGVGKSQLSIEYSYRVRCQSPATWVFWVHASNAARFEQSFRDIADQAKIPWRHDPTVNIFQLVESWLRDGKRGNWLLILDNVDDDRFLQQPPATGQQGLKVGQINTSTKPLLAFLPRSQKGSIMITSRNQEVALKIVDRQDIIKIEPMKKAEAIELLQRKLRLQVETPDIVNLVEELEFMPLAIIQAAGYIAISEDLFRGYYKIKGDDPSSEETTLDYSKDDTKSTPYSSVDHNFEDDITTLRDFSFISINNDSTVFTMHRLVQLTVRIWLEADGHLERWKEQFIMILWQRFPTGEFENWAKCQSLFPHVKSVMSQRPESEECLRKWATLLHKGAWYARGSGKIAESIDMASKSRNERASLFGSDGEETLDSTAILASVHRLQGRWEEAEQLEVQVMEARKTIMETLKTKFGEDHPDTLSSMGNLALIYRCQDRWEEAEQLFVQVIETSKTKLGADHPSTLTSMGNLALTYRYQGRWEDAERLFVQVIETSKTKLGADHHETLTSIGNLALMYSCQGRWEEAEQLFVQVIEKSKMKLGADHPHTLTSMANLASTYQGQDRWEEAEQLFVQVIEKSKTKLGADHPDMLISLAKLASTYQHQGQWEEAEQLFMQVIEKSKMKLGADYPYILISMANPGVNVSESGTLISMANLASTYQNQGRLEEAEQLNVKIMETSKTKLGADHPYMLISMANLASMYQNQGRLEEAEQLNVKVMETFRTKLGADHPSTLATMGNLASIYMRQGRWQEAKRLEVQVVEMRKAKLGADHPETLTSMHNLAHDLRSLGQNTAALLLMADCVRLCDRKLGPGHPHTMSSKSTLNKWSGEGDTGGDGGRTIFSRLFSRN
ncbi:hypothetical protein N7481_007270 [Penicillium waksmanii]|uniref:uncharacterized protein n=1 Tax=Penicillium waksmanii TaxID=69791 RepID=UPI0025475D96|nr:uncharacterized protein N7481_007270 [Penicillium waksmanii]KAJ5979972.1 hypothetical protein N7481_007270 [Penicillium waksmanii]